MCPPLLFNVFQYVSDQGTQETTSPYNIQQPPLMGKLLSEAAGGCQPQDELAYPLMRTTQVPQSARQWYAGQPGDR